MNDSNWGQRRSRQFNPKSTVSTVLIMVEATLECIKPLYTPEFFIFPCYWLAKTVFLRTQMTSVPKTQSLFVFALFLHIFLQKRILKSGIEYQCFLCWCLMTSNIMHHQGPDCWMPSKTVRKQCFSSFQVAQCEFKKKKL